MAVVEVVVVVVVGLMVDGRHDYFWKACNEPT